MQFSDLIVPIAEIAWKSLKRKDLPNLRVAKLSRWRRIRGSEGPHLGTIGSIFFRGEEISRPLFRETVLIGVASGRGVFAVSLKTFAYPRFSDELGVSLVFRLDGEAVDLHP